MLPAINRTLLLKRVDGNAELARRLIRDFRRDHADAAGRLAAQLASGRSDEARRLAHLLRGFAGNLGMLELAAAARDVEGLAPLGGAALDAAQARFRTALAAALEAAGGLDLGAPPAEACAQPDRAVPPGLAAELDRLLRNNDLAALDLAGRLRAALGEAGGLCDAVERLDFPVARALLSRLAEDMGWEV